MGNTHSNNEAREPRAASLSRRAARVTQSLPSSPIHARHSSRDATAPWTAGPMTLPPYTEIDEAQHGDQTLLPARQVSRRTASMSATSTTPTSFHWPPTAAHTRPRTQSDSATQLTPPSTSPLSSRVNRTQSAKPSVPPTNGWRRSIARRAPTSPELQRQTFTEDPLEVLRKYDTVCIVDDSSSMEGPLWYEARDALAGIVDVAARYDDDGVDIHFLNSPLTGNNLESGDAVEQLFDRVRPQGVTPTGEKLEELLLDYLLKIEDARVAQTKGDATALKKIKPVNFLVITDGEATDDPEPVIVQAAKRLDEGRFPLSQVGIQFVQIGSDQAAAEALRALDDDLASSYGVRDMVDTVPYSAEGGQLTAEVLVKILLGGINRRQDRQK